MLIVHCSLFVEMADFQGEFILDKLRSWFSQAKEATHIEDDRLGELPEAMALELERKIQALPVPSVYETTVRETIASSVETWQNNLDAENSLAIVASPVEPLVGAIEGALQEWDASDIDIITLLPCCHRPDDPLQLLEEIDRALQRENVAIDRRNNNGEKSDEDILAARRTVLVIPNLSQCFLRCIGGWQSIERLRDTIARDRSFFWVAGCTTWSWQFLDYVCQIGAYIERVCLLPELDAKNLCQWLDTVENTISHPEVKSNDVLPDRYQTNWDTLAEKSRGLSQVAACLWLRSLRLPQEKIEQFDDDREIDLTDIERVAPQAPSLPELEAIDRYLLHSILIHDRISLPHLALSFGEPESLIRPRIQILLQKEAICIENNLLAVHPIYYLRIKTELENNNFFTGEV